jgi:DNA mismatch endonuclease, patch repair protein
MSLANERPKASSSLVEKRMKNTPQRDTPKELALRRALHKRGLRYLVDASPIRGLRRRADIVFRGPRVAVFVDGCFWHRCPTHGTMPASNSAWWSEKLSANVERDCDTNRRLEAAGWQVVRIWEHESMSEAVRRVEYAIRASRQHRLTSN